MLGCVPDEQAHRREASCDEGPAYFVSVLTSWDLETSASPVWRIAQSKQYLENKSRDGRSDHHLIVCWHANSIKLSSNMQNDMILQWLHIHFPSWLAARVSICHRLLCPIIWLALNTPVLGELSCVPPSRAIHKQSHYNMYSHISNNETDGHWARRLICFPHERWEKRYFHRASFNADCFYSQRRAAGCRAVGSARMKDNLVFINFSRQQRRLLWRFRVAAE